MSVVLDDFKRVWLFVFFRILAEPWDEEGLRDCLSLVYWRSSGGRMKFTRLIL